MAEFRATFGESDQLRANFTDSQSMNADFGNVIEVDKSVNLQVATKAEWDAQPSLIGQAGTVYVYSDQYTNPDDQPVPGFKVGDGLAYLIDLPFNDDILMRSMVTDEERAFWNNKVTAYLDANDLENLVLSKE